MKKKFNSKKALVMDSSGLDPLVFSINAKDLSIGDIASFFTNSAIDLYGSAFCLSEYSYSLVQQEPLFVTPLETFTIASSDYNKTMYISDTGVLSGSSYDMYSVSITNIFTEEKKQTTLWEESDHWAFLSEEDKNLISTANFLKQEYPKTAILTNDWHLRQQCSSYEQILPIGTCSLLAGLVLTNIINYQKATAIYHKWLDKNPRWIPNNNIEKRKKMTFGEVLSVEKERWRDKNSFWF